MPQMNLTPMIDVVFLLIVFFMATSKFADDQREIDLKLPEVAKADASDSAPKTRQVAVYAGGRITLDDQDVTLAELTAQLTDAHDKSPALSVVVLGDAACEYQHIAAALAACKDAGVGELSVSVRIAQGNQGASSERR